MSIFEGCDRKPISKKKDFSGLSRASDTVQGFLGALCDGIRSAPSVHHFVRRCSQSALSGPPKLRFGPEKLINSTLFEAGGNNTLELTSNLTAEVDFLLI